MIEVGAGQGGDADLEADHHVPLPLPPGTVLTACLGISIGTQKTRVQERGGLEAWRVLLDRELQGWVELQRDGQQRMELNVCLKGDKFNAANRLTEEDVAEVGRLLPYVFQALAPLAASIHTLRLERSSCRLDTSVMVLLVDTLPSLRELSITACHLTASGLHPLSQLQQLRLLFLSHLLRDGEVGLIVAGVSALLVDSAGSMAGVGEGRLSLEWCSQHLFLPWPVPCDLLSFWPLATEAEEQLTRQVGESLSAAGKVALVTPLRLPARDPRPAAGGGIKRSSRPRNGTAAHLCWALHNSLTPRSRSANTRIR